MISPYEMGFLIYRFFYSKIQRKFPYASICTGSLLMGGAGKTPLTIKIIEELISAKKKPALIIRGYKRKFKKDLIIKGGDYSPFDTGDEAYLYLRRFGDKVIIGISKKRERIAELIKEKYDPDIFVLDDAYQYLKYRFWLNILIMPYEAVFRKEKIFPFGKLREDYKGIKRADLLVINEKFDYLNRKEKISIRKILKNMGFIKEIIFMRYVLKDFKNYTGKKISIRKLSGKKLFAFCGIGEPESFFKLFKRINLDLKERIKFPDHHFYRHRDLEKIFSKKYDYFITTEKDLIKIKNPPDNLIYPEFDIEIDREFTEKLIKELKY